MVKFTILAVMAFTANAFTSPSLIQQQKKVSLQQLRSSPQESVEALRAAAAKAREEADRLSEELGKKPSKSNAAAVANVKPAQSKEKVKEMLPTIIAESDVNKQVELWQDLKSSSSIKAFGSANLQSFPVSMQMLTSRTGLDAVKLGLDDRNVDLDDFKWATVIVALGSAVSGVLALAFLPPNIGATICYALALLPILFLGIGSTAPGIIADAIARIKGTRTAQLANIKERQIRHESAHFCCGYWCGLPIASYSLDTQPPRVEFAVNNSGEYSPTEVAALSVTALSGIVGEALKFDNSGGSVVTGSAQEDLMVLENQVFRRSREFLGAVAQQDLTRWGALTASLLLQKNAAQYEKVVEAFGQNKSVEECIEILES